MPWNSCFLIIYPRSASETLTHKHLLAAQAPFWCSCQLLAEAAAVPQWWPPPANSFPPEQRTQGVPRGCRGGWGGPDAESTYIPHNWCRMGSAREWMQVAQHRNTRGFLWHCALWLRHVMTRLIFHRMCDKLLPPFTDRKQGWELEIKSDNESIST